MFLTVALFFYFFLFFPKTKLYLTKLLIFTGLCLNQFQKKKSEKNQIL